MKMALLIANRGFFPSSTIASARQEMVRAMRLAGIEPLLIDEGATRHGAVETASEGEVFARFLAHMRGNFDGLVLCLPNFGDENGIKAAIAEAGVPVLLQAYPDEIGQMDFAHRRDAFCGKMALTSVLRQMDYRYTAFSPFVVHPQSEAFSRQLHTFKQICAIVRRMKRMRVGAFGARTTAFKSVRYDEMALERHGIDVETVDLSQVFARMNGLMDGDGQVKDFLDRLHQTADFSSAPGDSALKMAKLGAAMAGFISEMGLDALAIRCWAELQQQAGITPCAVLGVLNQQGIPCACEMDVTNALPMLALATASGQSSGCLDWNNNYGDDQDACILFHCGPLPLSLMRGPGVIEEHKMLSKSYGAGCSWGLNVGKIRMGQTTFSSMRTEAGQLQYYIGQGEIVDLPVEDAFFGCSGVLRAPDLQRTLQCISDAGFRHHVTITAGDVVQAVDEAFFKYLGYQKIRVQ